MAPPKGWQPHNKLSPEREAEVAASYLITNSRDVTAKQFSISPGTVMRIAHERGIARAPWGHRPEEKQAIAADIQRGLTGPKVAALHRTSHTTVYSIWNEFGLTPETNYEEDCNHDYFDVIDTREKAYWLGMLVTDGCISEENEVILSLKSDDWQHVEALKSALGSKAKLSFCKQKKFFDGYLFEAECARVAVRSKRLSRALADLGILPGKTRDPRMVTAICADLWPDFWRGSVDGDGWLCWSARKYPQFIVGFTGAMALVEPFREFCRQHCPTRANIGPNHHIYRFKVTDWLALAVARVLYQSAPIYLPRKYARFEEAEVFYGGRNRPNRRWPRLDGV
jgi:hypothetical protein